MKLVISIGVLFILLFIILAVSIGVRREGFNDMINISRLEKPLPAGPTRCETCCFSGPDTCDPNDKCQC